MHLSLLPCNDLENLQTLSGNGLGEKNTAKYNTGVIPIAQKGQARCVARGAGGARGMAGMAGASRGSTASEGGTARYLSRWYCRRGLNEQRWKRYEI